MTDAPKRSRGKGLIVMLALLAIAGAAAFAVSSLAPKHVDFTMEAIINDVYQRFPEVDQLTAEDVAARLASDKPPLLIDARDEAEFNVSHIPGAIRIDSGSKPEEVVAKVGTQAQGRDVVFYCSVGMRASSLASASQDALGKAGASGVHNLVGGIYGWHNDKRPLVDANGPTEAIGPMKPNWAKLITRQDKVKLAP